MNLSQFALRLLVLAAAITMQARADNPPAKPEPFMKEKMHTVEASIQAIDATTRTITLRGPKGETSFVAGPEVRNFDNIRVGDKVRVGYYEAVAAEIQKKGTSGSEPAAAGAVYRAPVGSQPAAAAARAINATVKIEAVDTKANTVTVKRSDGSTKKIDVKSPEGHKFIRTLHAGDDVEITYIDALAIEVVPVAKSATK
jgi:Cu/Ag efflux protein CusF